MDQKIMFKQMIDFQKGTFDNAFKAMATLHEQGEKMVGMFIEQAAWLPPEGKKAISDWISAYKKGRDEFKKTVESNFQKVNSFFASEKAE